MSVPPPLPRSSSAVRRSEYSYRRTLEPLELLPAIGAGVAAGLAAFYVVRELLARTPLEMPAGAGDPAPLAFSDDE